MHLALENLKPRMEHAETSIKELEDVLTNYFWDNWLVISFNTLDGLRVTDGWFDEVNGRLVVR